MILLYHYFVKIILYLCNDDDQIPNKLPKCYLLMNIKLSSCSLLWINLQWYSLHTYPKYILYYSLLDKLLKELLSSVFLYIHTYLLLSRKVDLTYNTNSSSYFTATLPTLNVFKTPLPARWYKKIISLMFYFEFDSWWVSVLFLFGHWVKTFVTHIG